MQYSLVKVLPTVSPFRPSSSPQPSVSQSFNPCSQSRSADAEMLPTAHYSLSTFCQLRPLSTACTQKHRVWGPDSRIQPSTVSVPSVPLWQIHCFHTTARSLSLLPLFLQPRPFVFNTLHALLQKHPGVGGIDVQTFRRSDIQTLRGGGELAAGQLGFASVAVA
jgi:hypothetical protein